ncbi:phosphatidylglycerophosphatase A [Kerstersia gyiorum]|jgi:phosphatidylglycerophosphatase A|uniref:Phosphatidylglycerophosphatase A n=1 Tax=Kerstersia gyiorum TaxID=206506 RepID=A0A171KNJ2_9BURK|nr:phosphatidylglycerophosphatase A [Kerstersia gyiorum]AZV92832.1 phosphatidylglycerophosphatase A [Bordetella sp. J329]MCO7641464.1 phosphatidylglycerophosphatase A [Pseudomonas sp. S 311-6]KAB0544631.1 phosphatidylglycerophosphatase A [Kerstersia gyiorum]KKO70459.1 phosphatidylglycerophosphatase [Kerstersia gyiorum]MCH4271102.1 phosphatidylglycerophosphatase A [Kerstersia gyiorum]
MNSSKYGNGAPVQPTLAWALRSPARFLAVGLGSGLLRPAPGTWGTLAAWLLWLLVPLGSSSIGIGVILLLCFIYGCWICQRTGMDLGVPDHGAMVWDEMVAFWLVLWLSPAGWWAQLCAFLLFRLFDIVKPAPIRQLDAHFKNGFGVMLDDLLAAGYTLIVMLLLGWIGLFG